MELISYISRFFLRIKWWLLFVPLFVTLVAIYDTRNLTRIYEVKTTVYTGAVSGLSISADGTMQNVSLINNTIDNLINIITSKNTLRTVSMRLFAQHMMHGDTNKDNNYILAEHYRHLLDITPQEVEDLIDKNSEKKTLQRLFDYADANTENFLYGLFNWAPPYYSYEALSQIEVKRLGSSDMLEITYITDDPGVTYQTLTLLNEEFMKQYEDLQLGETGKIVHFFEEELARNESKLKTSEDSLTSYNIQKRIVNYDEQTKNLASMSRDFQLQLEEIFLQYNSSETLVAELEQRIGENVEIIQKNSLFLSKLKEVSDLSAEIARFETFQNDSADNTGNELKINKERLRKKEEDFKDFLDEFNAKKYSKEGYPSVDLIQQWLVEVLKLEEAKAQLKVMDQWQAKLDQEYIYYSPIGSIIKRKEREINFTEANYLAILQSLNSARLRQKSMQMNSATLRILNPPTYPLSSAPTKRRIKIMTACIASFIFVLGYFLLLELLDHTLRDKIRTERITSGKVIGAFSGTNYLRHRGYAKKANEIAARSLGNRLLHYMEENGTLILNIISIEHGEGKTFIAEQLTSYFTDVGLKVRTLSHHNDFNPSSSEYLLAKTIDDLSVRNEEQITLVEYPPLKESAIPARLLKQGHVNLLILRSTRSWKVTDKILYMHLKEQAKNSPVFMILNKTKREEVEYFTGLLPPYTFVRKFIYRISQLGLTSID